MNRQDEIGREKAKPGSAKEIFPDSGCFRWVKSQSISIRDLNERSPLPQARHDGNVSTETAGEMSEANLFNTAGVRIDGKCAIEDLCTDESQHIAAPSQRHHCQPGYTGAVLIHADETKSLVCERRWMTMRDDELDNNAWPELALARD